MKKPGIPAPGFVKRIGPVIDERRSVEFRPLIEQDGLAPAGDGEVDGAAQLPRE